MRKQSILKNPSNHKIHDYISKKKPSPCNECDIGHPTPPLPPNPTENENVCKNVHDPHFHPKNFHPKNPYFHPNPTIYKKSPTKPTKPPIKPTTSNLIPDFPTKLSPIYEKPTTTPTQQAFVADSNIAGPRPGLS